MKNREFWGEQSFFKVNSARDIKEYRLFLFNDLFVYGTGRPQKYKIHRVLILVFCTLEDIPNNKSNVNSMKYAFRILSPQKNITIALPTAEYKQIIFDKIEEAIKLQKQRYTKLIEELSNLKDPKLQEKAKLFRESCAFLHQDSTTVKRERPLYDDNCKLCLSKYGFLTTKRKQCPQCKDSICQKCIQATTKIQNKKKNVCDGCIPIIENKYKW